MGHTPWTDLIVAHGFFVFGKPWIFSRLFFDFQGGIDVCETH
jgi:hypothetical protein